MKATPLPRIMTPSLTPATLTPMAPPPGIPLILPSTSISALDGSTVSGGEGTPAPLLCIKRTWQPNVHKRKKTHGFLKR